MAIGSGMLVPNTLGCHNLLANQEKSIVPYFAKENRRLKSKLLSFLEEFDHFVTSRFWKFNLGGDCHYVTC